MKKQETLVIPFNGDIHKAAFPFNSFGRALDSLVRQAGFRLQERSWEQAESYNVGRTYGKKGSDLGVEYSCQVSLPGQELSSKPAVFRPEEITVVHNRETGIDDYFVSLETVLAKLRDYRAGSHTVTVFRGNPDGDAMCFAGRGDNYRFTGVEPLCEVFVGGKYSGALGLDMELKELERHVPQQEKLSRDQVLEAIGRMIQAKK